MPTMLAMLVDRVSQLPESVQAVATQALLDIENRHSLPYTFSPIEDAFVQEGIDAYERGERLAHADVMTAAYNLVAA